MEFVRCQGLTRKAKKCSYTARYGKFCGHHTSPSLQAKYLMKAMLAGRRGIRLVEKEG